MKRFTIGMSLMMFAMADPVNAQEIPVPAEETQPVEAAISETNTVLPDQNTPDQNSNDVDQETSSEEKQDVQLIAFFDGLDNAVQGEDCEAISNAIREYCQSHQDWINSLDYVSGNVDAQTIQAIHEKAMSFGKKLSVCYDEKSIPALLRRYAGLGNEL